MVEINNRTDYNLDLEDLKIFVQRALSEEMKLSIAFLEPSEIKKFNKKYRDSEGPTDVLSFEGDKEFLGEVLVSPKVVEEQAKRHGLKFDREIRRVLIHGVLHLLGYDHKKKDDKKEMREKEEEFLSG
ncbi:MAG: rRNA maturation RNase YbeY [Patescibacteria group bacterium]